MKGLKKAFAGACVSAGLLAAGALGAATPAAADSVRVSVELVGSGYGYGGERDMDDGGWRGRGGGWDDDWRWRHERGGHDWRWRRGHRPAYYRGPPISIGPRCVFRTVRYYSDYEDAYVTKRVKTCSYW
jgi:hypothetical protein